MVAGAPDGATAVAALHFDLTSDETSPVLTLMVADNGSQNGDKAIMAACLTGSAWSKASAGSWGDKPSVACDRGSVNGLQSEDKKSWTFALEPFLAYGAVDVMIVPGVDPALPAGTPNGSTFQVIFNAPTSASLKTTQGSPSDAQFDVPSFGDSSASPAFDVSTPSFSSDAGSFTPPPSSSSSFTPSLPAADQGLTATAPIAQQANPPLPTKTASAVADHRSLAMLVLVICGAALLWTAQQQTPATQRLGTFGGEAAPAAPAAGLLLGQPEPGGLGRFAKPRTGSPPAL
jgi:hypothetical protein